MRRAWASRGGCVELIVAQSALREPVERRSRHRAAEGASVAEADIIQNDYQHIRCAFRCLERLREIGFRVLVSLADGALEGGFRLGQDFLRPA